MTTKTLDRSFTRKDFRVETMRGSGAGGQHRNTTDSCVRITHIETGLCAQDCSSRSQHQNKATAFHKLSQMLSDYYYGQDQEVAFRSDDEVRTYKIEDDLVVDQSGFKQRFETITKPLGFGDLIIRRRKSL